MQKTEVLESWVSLWRVPGIGSVTFKKLLDKFETPGNVFAATASSLKQAGFSEKLVSNIKDNPSSNSTKNDIDWLNTAQNHHLITIHCSEYPILLKQISNPPPLLYVHGKLALLNDPQVAIIGSRNPTQGGLSNTYEFSKFL
ncbi:MAG TPA: DNA-protecting protein DprA, partial [Leucothrix sp.]|nr:DNA-protecting protein DprA [Leucothrix sp.]